MTYDECNGWRAVLWGSQPDIYISFFVRRLDVNLFTLEVRFLSTRKVLRKPKLN